MTKVVENGNRLTKVDGGDNGLFRSLQLAGGSFGITTEFHYGIFDVLVELRNKYCYW